MHVSPSKVKEKHCWMWISCIISLPKMYFYSTGIQATPTLLKIDSPDVIKKQSYFIYMLILSHIQQICSRQFWNHIGKIWQTSLNESFIIEKSWKHCDKGRNYSFWVISPFIRKRLYVGKGKRTRGPWGPMLYWYGSLVIFNPEHVWRSDSKWRLFCVHKLYYSNFYNFMGHNPVLHGRI